jgi:hypothetical protein
MDHHLTDENWDTIRGIARLLVSERGERSATYARHQALKAQAKGEPLRAELWHTIADVAEQTMTSADDAEGFRRASGTNAG